MDMVGMKILLALQLLVGAVGVSPENPRLRGTDSSILWAETEPESPLQLFSQESTVDAGSLAKSSLGMISKIRSTLSSAQYAQVGASARMSLLTWAIYTILLLLVYTVAYKRDGPEDVEEPGADAVETFTKSHFDCLSDSRICICAFVCPPLRWADTMDHMDVLRFSTGLTLFVILALVNEIVFSVMFLGLATTILMLYGRQEIRKKIHVQNSDVETCFLDFCFVLLCPWCAIAQEARVSRELRQAATKAGSEVFERVIESFPTEEQKEQAKRTGCCAGKLSK